MAGFSQYAAQRTLDFWLLNNSLGSSTPGVSLYLALFTADPADITANEANWTGYSRPAISSWQAITTSGTTSSTSNSSQVTFPAVAGAAVSVAYWGIFNAASGGNLLFSGALSGGTRTLNVGDVMVLAAGQLTITLD